MKPIVTAAEMTTAYGPGIDAAWTGLLAGRSALALSERISFPRESDRTPLGLVPTVDSRSGPAVLQMLEPMLRKIRPQLPDDTLILLATTTGEIELLEAAILQHPGAQPLDASDPGLLLEKLCALCGLARGRVVSAACASSTLAVSQAAALIASGAEDSVLVIACDAVSEFVYAGFATMQVLDPAGARPFDRDRQGLNLGEAAGLLLLLPEDRARRERRPILGRIAGWAASNDATHVTRPDTSGAQLARASRLALERAGVPLDQVGFVSAHGTGTRYNDAMELAAFRSLLPPCPVFSVKGAIGHTLAVSGLVQIIVSLRALAEGVVPPSVGLRNPDDSAAGWVTHLPQPASSSTSLVTNSGFGGINAALVLTRDSTPAPRPLSNPSTEFSSGIGCITATAYARIRRGEFQTYSNRTTTRLVGSVDALFRHKIESFGRFDPVSRMTCYACALALRDAGIDYSPDTPQEIGILGAGFTGSLAANAAYFKDYVTSGRILARGNLFVYTLPSAPLGEAAIHFGFRGPLFALISAQTPLVDAIAAARLLVENGDAPAMLAVHAEADSAIAAVITPGSGDDPLISRLVTLAEEHPRLSTLIPQLASHIEEPAPCT
jgi:3-oxoacyl-[acyl-carrier-protein] synthase II